MGEMTTPIGRSEAPAAGRHVRLVYHYNDGHDFVTESMLVSEAEAYMPVLRARRVDESHFVAAFATIEMRAA